MKQRNIVFLMTDQHRWDALGCVNSVVRTPHLDRLAAEGVRFEQAVTNCPICVPARYSMMTGLYPSQSGLRFNRQICATDAELPCSVIPQELRSAGYQTAGFGKTHWYDRDLGAEPTTRGFEIRGVLSEGFEHVRESGAEFMEDDFGGEVGSIGEIRGAGTGGESPAGYVGKTSDFGDHEHREGWATDKAVDFLENRRDPERPFFLYLSLDFPHAPNFVPPGYEALYDLDSIPDRPLADVIEEIDEHYDFKDGEIRHAWLKMSPQERKIATLRYYALCSYSDDCIGRVLEQLDASGEFENTTFLFCSDHGEMLGDRNHRFSKYCLYEGSVRVPIIVAGADISPEHRGTVDSRHAELVDVLPTLRELAAIAPDPLRPGISLLSDLRREGSFAEFHGGGYEAEQRGPTYMWRTGDWKLILSVREPLAQARFKGRFHGELYHLTEDPVELVNRFADPACRDRREQMTQNLLFHLACQNAAWPRRTTDVALPASNKIWEGAET